MSAIASHIPVLETERLTLRLLARPDFDPYRAILMSDRAVYMDGPMTRKAAWACFASDVASWLLDGHGYWAARPHETDEPVAFVGITKPATFPEPELGWMATPEGERKGYVFEAAKAALAWAFGEGRFKTLVSYVDPRNARSIAMAERLGAWQDKDAPAPDEGALVYRHPLPEALQ